MANNRHKRERQRRQRPADHGSPAWAAAPSTFGVSTSVGQAARPTPLEIARYFVDTYGWDRLFFTVSPFSRAGMPINGSTFGPDNARHLEPWLILQQTKLHSRVVAVLVMVVRVFDHEHTVEVTGPRGKINIPTKTIFMFRYDLGSSVGIEPDEAMEAHTTDANTGALLPAEPGVSMGSGAEVILVLTS